VVISLNDLKGARARSEVGNVLKRGLPDEDFPVTGLKAAQHAFVVRKPA
jgi:hypothetical protein